jgi:PEP-CTERM motif
MMKAKLFTVAALATVLAFAGQARAALIGAGTPIPDAEVIINFNGTGLDWAYAGPIAPNEFGPGQIELPSFRSAEGWRHATQAEWVLRPDWDDFIKPGFTIVDVPPVGGWNDHTKYRFTSEYWSTFTHVDISDYAGGRVTNGSDIGSLNQVWETIYVRDSAEAIANPEPASLALLGLGGLGLVGGVIKRRRNRATA